MVKVGNDGFSVLNWLRNLLAMHQACPVFPGSLLSSSSQ